MRRPAPPPHVSSRNAGGSPDGPDRHRRRRAHQRRRGEHECLLAGPPPGGAGRAGTAGGGDPRRRRGHCRLPSPAPRRGHPRPGHRRPRRHARRRHPRRRRRGLRRRLRPGRGRRWAAARRHRRAPRRVRAALGHAAARLGARREPARRRPRVPDRERLGAARAARRDARLLRGHRAALLGPADPAGPAAGRRPRERHRRRAFGLRAALPDRRTRLLPLVRRRPGPRRARPEVVGCGAARRGRGLAARGRGGGARRRRVTAGPSAKVAAVGERRDGADLAAGLNPQQARAVTHPEGPVLVVAGAGSGKTRVLTHRIAYLVRRRGVRPRNVLAITFTNRAANEMRERMERLNGGTRGMWVLTFHAACGRILRREAEHLGYRSNFTIYDDADQVRVVKSCLETLDRDPKRFPPRGIHSRISAEKNRLVAAAEFRDHAGGFYDELVADVFELYERRLHEANAMDFDDLLVRTVELLERFPDVRERWQDRFRHLLVDEYQDTNHAQYRFVQLIGERTRNVFVVGDADQSVYSWRGADIQNILGFEKDFPDAETIRLEQNYRSTQTILDAANAVIEHNEGRLEKHLWSELGRGDPVR